jgi:hypothetical protein
MKESDLAPIRQAGPGRDTLKKMSLSAKGVPAGKKILREDPRQQKILESELRKRQYTDDQAEHTRSLIQARMIKKVSSILVLSL